MTTSTTYTARLIGLLEEMVSSQDEVLDRVAERLAETIEQRGLIHLFGSGHSVIPTLDAYPRYGSFVGLHPLTDPRLMWHNVLGPGGVRELLWLEREEHYVEHFLEHEPINAGDVLVVYSHSGRNAAGIEAAQYAAKRGVFTVAVTSIANRARAAVHSSGSHLSDVCDAVIDTGVPIEDAVYVIEGSDRPFGGTSTVVATAVSHELITRTAAIVIGRGGSLATFVSPTVAGASLSSNDEVFAAHRALLHEAEGRAIG
ncbi:MAG TPA: sugar isomerase domain-containing protein [Acidimicrobiales bacterium]|nr:sugar isomerase domain-containing protein [Acidimicrobiales bacterium]